MKFRTSDNNYTIDLQFSLHELLKLLKTQETLTLRSDEGEGLFIGTISQIMIGKDTLYILIDLFPRYGELRCLYPRCAYPQGGILYLTSQEGMPL